MQKRRKLVYGVGVNDSDYKVFFKLNGKQVTCPFYETWNGMLKRCYSQKFQAKQPTYIGCYVRSEWHRFMAFREWMSQQDWQGKALDKDLLFPENKFYGPDSCVFVTQQLNSFTTDRAASRGDWPIGVYWGKHAGKFRALCCNPFIGKREHLGYFACPEAAHEAWRKRKHELALQLAAGQTDTRLAKALSIRYLK